MIELLRPYDDRALEAMNGFARRTPWLHGIALDVAAYGVVLFAVLLLADVVTRRADDDRRLAIACWACLAPLAAVALNQVFVNSIAEARPYTTHPSLLVLANRSTDFSFPSDHAVMAGAAAAALWLVARRLALIATVAAVLLALSRVYIAAHYPWDVIVGLALGAFTATAGWLVLARPMTSIVRWVRHLPALRQLFPPSLQPN